MKIRCMANHTPDFFVEITNSTYIYILSMRRALLSLIFTIAAVIGCLGQIPIKLHSFPSAPPDSTDVVRMEKRHFWRAAAEVFGFNMGLWAFDRYVQKGDFAYISWSSMKRNITSGFKWDNDKLGTNTFLHPYNGSLYFNAGRSNGFNFWQSELFAIAGSGMWEVFMEREYPSTNDFIATPIGGAALGEIFYRSSDAVLDDRSRGVERAGRELAAFIISPMRGINRLVTGDMWRVRPTMGRQFGSPAFALRASLGYKFLVYNSKYRDNHQGVAIQVDAEYGDRFEVKSTKPYDYFTFKAQLQVMKTQPLLTQVEIKGRLLARELFDNFASQGSIGLYQHFDFYDSDTIGDLKKVPFKLGIPACVGAGFLYRGVEMRKWVFDLYAHANGILLGSILSDHYQTDERNYNWASGFSLKGGFNLVFDKSRIAISLSHNYFRLFTWKGYPLGTDLRLVDFRTLNAMGDKSVASLNMTEVRADFRLWRHLYATALFTNYVRTSHYHYYADVHSHSSALSLMLSYKF